MPTAASRWHLSPNTGKQERCKAQVCPFGGDHWATSEEAKSALKLRVLTKDFIAAKERYDRCAKCGTADPARLYFDRSQKECNACSNFSTLLSRMRANMEVSLNSKIKKYRKLESFYLTYPEQQVESDRQRQQSLLANAQQKLFEAEAELTQVKTKEFSFTKEEFLMWRTDPAKHNNAKKAGGECCYCGVSDADLHKARYFNARSGVNGNFVARLGIDRIDSSAGYTFANMQLCCYGCNTVKGSEMSHEEMQELAPVLAKRTAKRVAQYDAAANA